MSRKSWEQFFPEFGHTGVFDISKLSITAGADVASAMALSAVVERKPAERVALVVRWTVCLRKMNGQWRGVYAHPSEPSPRT